jgi:hypothetical protein
MLPLSSRLKCVRWEGLYTQGFPSRTSGVSSRLKCVRWEGLYTQGFSSRTSGERCRDYVSPERW